MRGMGEAVATASNAAVGLYKVGIPIDRIVIPIACMTGSQVIFAAVYLLDPCFPVMCYLTTNLIFRRDMDEAAKYFLALLDCIVAMEKYIDGAVSLTPRSGNELDLMALDLEKYHTKDLDNFFRNRESDEESIRHFLSVTEKLISNTEAFLFAPHNSPW